MIKKLLLILLYLPIIGFGQINFKEIKGKNDCHMCPGTLIVEKNNLSDTLKLGSWGRLPNYELIKSGNVEYIFVESNYLSVGIIESSFMLFSTDETNFLENIFTIRFLSNEYRYIGDENNSFEQIIRDFKLLDITDNYMSIDIDTSVWLGSDMYENTTFKSKGSKVQSFLINRIE
tara:strand:- start:280 stop:804 length:525 start_codon:yes stop_codon:yes gene_type:complete